jgi:hypothetical protein
MSETKTFSNQALLCNSPPTPLSCEERGRSPTPLLFGKRRGRGMSCFLVWMLFILVWIIWSLDIGAYLKFVICYFLTVHRTPYTVNRDQDFFRKVSLIKLTILALSV